MNSSTTLYGLILSGGQSTRMGEDKALLKYKNKNQLAIAYELLEKFCAKTFVSVSQANKTEATRQSFPLIEDVYEFGGPFNGIASAFAKHPDTAWLVIACDLPLLTEATLEQLIQNRQALSEATAFISSYDQLPEPLCTIWEAKIYAKVQKSLSEKRYCPRKILINSVTHLLQPENPQALDNINTQEERAQVVSNKLLNTL